MLGSKTMINTCIQYTSDLLICFCRLEDKVKGQIEEMQGLNKQLANLQTRNRKLDQNNEGLQKELEELREGNRALSRNQKYTQPEPLPVGVSSYIEKIKPCMYIQSKAKPNCKSLQNSDRCW